MPLSVELTKESIEQAFQIIKQTPELLNSRKSNKYLLIAENGETYPPILVLSEAHQILGGEALSLDKDFNGNIDKPFKILNDLGYKIEAINQEDQSFYDELIKFLTQAKTSNLQTSTFRSTYQNLKVAVSFGKGNNARVPWIAFLNDIDSVQNGIYPVYLYYKERQLLILAYGKSETFNSARNWNVINEETINQYFKVHNLGKPERYGSSYVYKAYDIKQKIDEETMNTDLKTLISSYKALSTEKISIAQKVFNYRIFTDSGIKSGLTFRDQNMLRFIASLITKPFVILTGLSGSGKTKLAQAFAKWICKEQGQFCLVPVGADWTNREPLLGYTNALLSETYVVPENGALQLIINAINKPDKPHFLILDEMNLSHVERYFADFLSAMESKEPIFLHAGTTEYDGVPPSVILPDNLFIIGTVNIDETTYMFSPKVLDRANVIEFRVDESDMKRFLAGNTNLDLDKLKGQGISMASSFLEMCRSTYEKTDKGEQIKSDLLLFFNELKVVGAEFGYRTAAEILRFASVATSADSNWKNEQILDAAIMQKLLPKLHGSRRKLEPTLKALAELCLHDKAFVADALNPKKEIDFSDKGKVKFPISLEKLRRMNVALINNNFTSYAEA